MAQSNPRQLLSDLQRDLRQRWRSGDRRRVEDYLAEHPLLRDEPELLLELIRAEIEAEHESGGSVDLAGYLRRFPQLADQLCQTELPFNAAETHSLRAANPDSTQPHTRGLGSDGAYSGPPSFSAGRFEIVRAHAKGGLGEVFVAADLELNREVALKQIQSRLSGYPDSRARFVLEAEITGMLEHPGIVPVYSLGVYPNGSPFYAMRFIRGESLKQAIHSFHSAIRNPQSAFETVEFRKLLTRFVSVCHAVAYAHSRGVLHRDLKPDNIMLGDYGETLVVDWGLAKCSRHAPRDETRADAAETSLPPIVPRAHADAAASVQGQVIGTPAFMPPEQAEGKLDELTTAADIYSLGATHFMLLTGEPPFKGKSTDEVLTQVRAGSITQPATLAVGVPKPLEAICLKAMSKVPSDRYPSAKLLAEDIDKWLADEPVTAYREPWPDRARRWGRKHRTAVASATAGVAVILIALAGALGLTARHNVQLAAEQQKTEAANRDLRISNEQERLAKADAQNKHAEADAARADEAQARQRAEAVTGYLVAMFRSPDPALDGRTITMAEVLDGVVLDLEDKFADDPITKAALLNALGQSYEGLGLYPESIPILEQARDLREEHLGRTHQDTLGSMNNLASAYSSAGELTRATRLFEETLKLMQVTLGVNHVDTLTAMNNLAGTFRATGQLERAMPFYQETLKARRAMLGDEHPDTLTSMNNLALGYKNSGQPDRAAPLLEEALTHLRTKLGSEHPNTIKTMSALGNTYSSAGQSERALRLLEEALTACQVTFGPEHSDTLVCTDNLATAYFEAGQAQRAVPLFEKTFKLWSATLGADHPDTLVSMANLAEAYQKTKQLDKALPLLDDVLKLKQAKLGPEHPGTLISMNNLAMAYLAAGELDAAAPLLEETLSLMRAKAGADHPSTIGAMSNLAVVYLKSGKPAKSLPLIDEFINATRKRAKASNPAFATVLGSIGFELLEHGQYAAAEVYLRECLVIRQEKLPNDWLHFNTSSMLGAALARQRSFAEAEPLLIEGYEGMKAREDKIPANSKARLTEALQRLVDLYTAWEKPEDAAKWKAVLDAQLATPKSNPTP